MAYYYTRAYMSIVTGSWSWGLQGETRGLGQVHTRTGTRETATGTEAAPRFRPSLYSSGGQDLPTTAITP